MPSAACSAPTATSAATLTATASSMARSPTRSRSAAATATAPPGDYANLRTSNVAAPPSGTNLEPIRNEDGRRRFEWTEREGRRVLIQRSIVDPNLEWEVSQVRDSADLSLLPCEARGDQATQGPCFNIRSAARQADVPQRAPRPAASASATAFPTAISPIPTTRWPASPATCPGRPAAPAATCRSRRTTDPAAPLRAATRATSRPTIRRWRATRCSSSAATRPPRATSSPRSARPRR